MTSEALITAHAVSPTTIWRSSTASFVIEDTDDEAVPEIDLHVRGGGSLVNIHDPSLELVAGSELHGVVLL